MIGIETEEPKFVFDICLVFKLKFMYKEIEIEKANIVQSR
jgi:hypothetical protein